ncbi:MAG: dockerin type I domain-containing protein [Candidatus Gribaldobacteria bacterium]|nr:dockerin type I domain-containing protein [Candidatus Gribaldobacteria bacterium]
MTKKISLLILIFLFLPIFVFADNQFPSFPMAFWGNVTINDNPAPINTIIRAYYDTTLAGQVVVKEAGVYGYIEPIKQKLIIGEGTGVINFTFQSALFTNCAAVSYAGFASGLTVEKNLAFYTSGCGGGSGGSNPQPINNSGGGGGSVYIPPASTSTTKIGDANGDNKVDKYDFSLMMANWGKTGSNACDLNNDSKVDKYDFSLLMTKWGL